jgi:hypothetical protein
MITNESLLTTSSIAILEVQGRIIQKKKRSNGLMLTLMMLDNNDDDSIMRRFFLGYDSHFYLAATRYCYIGDIVAVTLDEKTTIIEVVDELNSNQQVSIPPAIRDIHLLQCAPDPFAVDFILEDFAAAAATAGGGQAVSPTSNSTSSKMEPTVLGKTCTLDQIRLY